MGNGEEKVEVTLNGLLDESLGNLTPLQKWAVERNFRRHPENRDRVLNAVEMHVAKTSPALMTTMDADGFTADTPFTTTAAGKGELLQVILDNLPAILDAIIKLIGLFGAIIACTLLTNAATAAGPSCANGVCALRARVSAVVSQPGSCSSPVTISPQIAAVPQMVNECQPVAACASVSARQRFRPLRAFFGRR